MLGETEPQCFCRQARYERDATTTSMTVARVLIAFCTAASLAAAQAVEFSGRVVAIADGDTLTILDASNTQHRIRVDGIDAPEKAQPFGDRSRRSLGELAHEREAVARCPKIDRFGRHVCKVEVDGLDVGLEQIRRGLAWHFKRYEHEQSDEDRKRYADSENDARDAKRGLWSDIRPVPPWTWREMQRGQ